MPVKVIGRGNILPAPVRSAEKVVEARAARAALLDARVDASRVDAIVARSKEIAAAVAEALAIQADAVAAPGALDGAVAAAATIVDGGAADVVVAVERLVVQQGGEEMHGASAVVLIGQSFSGPPPSRRPRPSSIEPNTSWQPPSLPNRDRDEGDE